MQDILNILFHYYPDMLYELPCEWNYRVWQCSQVRTIYTHIYTLQYLTHVYTHIYILYLQYLHTISTVSTHWAVQCRANY